MRARGLKLCTILVGEAKNKSRPMRARGLKLAASYARVLVGTVAPHAGAWIETIDNAFNLKIFHPMRARGLKPPASLLPCRPQVAPHAGAWIETPST